MTYFKIQSQHQIGLNKHTEVSQCSASPRAGSKLVVLHSCTYTRHIYYRLRSLGLLICFCFSLSTAECHKRVPKYTRTEHLIVTKHQYPGAKSSLRSHSRSVS